MPEIKLQKKLVYAGDVWREILKEDPKLVYILDRIKAVDAVPIADIEACLYEMAMNNTDNTLGVTCEEIIRRLDGLRKFSRERGTV